MGRGGGGGAQRRVFHVNKPITIGGRIARARNATKTHYSL